MEKKFLMLHCVNHNMFGMREKQLYGEVTLAQIDEELKSLADELNVGYESFHSNYEGAIVEKIHEAVLDEELTGVIINAGAWTHYSYAIRDALLMLKIPFVEVHMSNIHARDEFRHKSVLVDIAVGQITGFGLDSYLLGLRALANYKN